MTAKKSALEAKYLEEKLKKLDNKILKLIRYNNMLKKN